MRGLIPQQILLHVWRTIFVSVEDFLNTKIHNCHEVVVVYGLQEVRLLPTSASHVIFSGGHCTQSPNTSLFRDTLCVVAVVKLLTSAP